MARTAVRATILYHSKIRILLTPHILLMKIDVMKNDTENHSQMNLLGVTIDEHLNFSKHIGEVCKNASRKVGVLMRLRNMLTT